MAGTPLTMDKILEFPSISDVQLRPDGCSFAFVAADNFTSLTGSCQRFSRSSIWLCSTTPRSIPRRLTYGAREDSLPRWSPDGRSLAFLSDRGSQTGQRQLMLLEGVRLPSDDSASADGDGDGDGATALTDLRGDIPTPRGLNAVQWTPDGLAIIFLLEETLCRNNTAAAEPNIGNDAIEYEKAPAFVRLMRVDLRTNHVSVVSPRAAGQIWEFASAPNGEIAAVVSPLPFEHSWYECRLVVFAAPSEPADNGSNSATEPTAPVRELANPMRPVSADYPAQSRQVAQPQWSPDGTQIAFIW